MKVLLQFSNLQMNGQLLVLQMIYD